MTHDPRHTRNTERRQVVTERRNPSGMIIALIVAVIAIAIAVWAFSDGDDATTGVDDPAQTTLVEPGETTAPVETTVTTETTAPAETTTVAP